MFSPPAVADGLVFIGSCSGEFLACGLDSGKVHWSYDIKQDGGLSFHGDFLLSDDRIYAGSDGDAGSIYAARSDEIFRSDNSGATSLLLAPCTTMPRSPSSVRSVSAAATAGLSARTFSGRSDGCGSSFHWV